MRSRSFPLSALLGTLTLAACGDRSITTPAAPSLALNAPAPSVSATGKHIFRFGESVPADLETRVAARGGTVDWVSAGAGIAVVDGLSDAAAADLAAAGGVAAWMADELLALNAPTVEEGGVDEAAGDEIASPTEPNRASFFPRQWHMRQIGAHTAWARGELGSSGVTVGILDSGIDYLHADMLGLVDLARSVDFLPAKFNWTLRSGPDSGKVVVFSERDSVTKYFPTRARYTDLFYHGTHVAATVSSNGSVGAGVTSQVRLVAIKVCAYVNTCPSSSVLQGVVYAADQGLDVINLSVGGGFGRAGNGSFIGFVNSAFNYARSKGTTIVVSAGNSAADLDHNASRYSTYCDTPAVICVSATGPTHADSVITSAPGVTPVRYGFLVNGPWYNLDAPASYTNFGRSAVTLAAPGGNRGGAVWAACSSSSLLINCRTSNRFIVGLSGTSMASPHTTAAAALAVARVGRDPGAVRELLQMSADDLGESGTDPYYGKGRINVARLVGAN
jgi:subtilisin family serine protease